MHTDCSGTQHEDGVRLLQRLQAAAKLPVSSSQGANSAAAASITADAVPKIPPDMAEVSSLSKPASECMLAVQNSKEQGRQLAVTDDIAAGTEMWTEQPYVHVLLKQHRKQVCLLVNLKQSDKAVQYTVSSSSWQSTCLLPSWRTCSESGQYRWLAGRMFSSITEAYRQQQVRSCASSRVVAGYAN